MAFSSSNLNEIEDLYENIVSSDAEQLDEQQRPWWNPELPDSKKISQSVYKSLKTFRPGVTDPKTDIGKRSADFLAGLGRSAEQAINRAGGYSAKPPVASSPGSRPAPAAPAATRPAPTAPAATRPAPAATRPAPTAPAATRPAPAAPAATRPAAAKPAPARPAPVTQTGDRTKDLATWAKANERMISKVGTPQQRAILSAAKGGTQMPAPRPLSADIGDIKGAIQRSQERQAAQSGPMYSSPDVKFKMTPRTQRVLGLKDSYDIVLDYLLSQGHVDNLDEALYVMMEMDSKCIRSIVEGVMPEPINPVAHKAAQKTQKIYNLGKGTSNPNEAQSALKRTGPQLPGV